MLTALLSVREGLPEKNKKNVCMLSALSSVRYGVPGKTKEM